MAKVGSSSVQATLEALAAPARDQGALPLARGLSRHFHPEVMLERFRRRWTGEGEGGRR